jgi:hypothetical protein
MSWDHIITGVGPMRDIERFAEDHELVSGAVDPETGEVASGCDQVPQGKLSGTVTDSDCGGSIGDSCEVLDRATTSESQKREWNERLSETHRECVRVLIEGIVRGPDGEIDYESTGFRDANRWCTAHHQQIVDLADAVDRPGDMDWDWIERIYDFWPLFRSGREFDAYFSVVLCVHNDNDDN